MGYEICQMCGRPTFRCDCKDKANAPKEGKETYTRAEFEACLRLVARPSGLMLGVLKSVIEWSGSGQPMSPEFTEMLRKAYDDTVEAIGAVFGGHPCFPEMLKDAQMARKFWDVPWLPNEFWN